MEIHKAVEEHAVASAENRQQAVATKDNRDLALAREQLFLHFPCIPKASAEEILEHGFLKGSGRVGRSMTIDEGLKMLLAVTAHIRHRFTNYDTLITQIKNRDQDCDVKKAARSCVQERVEDIVEWWRGNGDPSEDMPSGVPIVIPNVSNEIIGGSRGDRERKIKRRPHRLYSNSRAIRKGREFNTHPQPPRERLSQDEAAKISNTMHKERPAHELEKAKLPVQPASLDRHAGRLQESSDQEPVQEMFGQALDLMDLDNETMGVEMAPNPFEILEDHIQITSDISTRNDRRVDQESVEETRVSKNKAKANQPRWQRFEERARKDSGLVKLDPFHMQTLTLRTVREVNKVQNRELEKGWEDVPDIGQKGPDSEARRSTTAAARVSGPGRISKSAQKKENRARNTVEDLKQHELNPRMCLTGKRLSRAKNLRAQLVREYGNNRYNEVVRDHEKAWKSFEHIRTALSQRSPKQGKITQHFRHQSSALSGPVLPIAGGLGFRPVEVFSDDCDGLEKDLNKMDIS